MPTFKPEVRELQRLDGTPLRCSPNFTGVSLPFALQHASPAQHAVLAAVQPHLYLPAGYSAFVTSKLAHGTHYKPMTLGKPGWHWDGYRHVEGRPDFTSYDPAVVHFCINFVEDPEHGPVSSTEYLAEPVSILGHDPYRELQVAAAGLQTAQFGANTLYSFDQGTVHRSGLVQRTGYRLFMRISVFKGTPFDQINTRPVQVYQDLTSMTHGN